MNRRLVPPVALALVAALVVAVGTERPAAATPVTVAATCATAGSPINGLFPWVNYTGMSTEVDVTGPASIAPGSTFTLTYDISATLDLHRYVVWGNSYWHIDQVGNGLYLRFTLPADATFQGWSAGSGGNTTIGSVSVDGNDLVIHTNTAVSNQTTWTQSLELPPVQVTYLAGASGNVSVKPGGAVAAPGNDPAQAPFFHMAITVNHFWTTPSPTDTPPPPVPYPPLDALNQITEYCQAGSLPTLYSAPIEGSATPTVTITTPTSGATLALAPPAAANHVAVTCANPPPGASCRARIDGGPWFTLPDTTHPLNGAPGSHTVEARMVDAAGQPLAGVAAAAATYTVGSTGGADVTPPTITITAPLQGATFTATQQPAPTFQFTCADPAPGAMASCSGEVAPSANGPWTPAPAGSAVPLGLVGNAPTHRVFRVTATDQAGNTSVEVRSFTVVPGPVDQTQGYTCPGGVAVVAVGGGAGPWNVTNCVPFTANLAPAQVGPAQPYTWSATMGAQTYGGPVGAAVTYSFAAAGGTFSAPTLTTPGVGVTGASVTVTTTGTVRLGFTTTAATFTPPAIAVTVSPTAALGQSVTTRLTRVSAGTQTVNPAWVTPPSGPPLTSTLVSTAADTTPPTITFPSPQHGSVWPAGTAIPVEFACADTGGGPAPTCTASPPGTASGTTITPAPGSHAIAVTAIDAAGNVAVAHHAFVVGTGSSQVTLAGCSATEGTDCGLVVSVTPPAAGPVTVHLDVAPGSASVLDFTAPAGTVVVPAGTAQLTVPVATLDDVIVETDESFTATITSISGAGAVVATPFTATGTIHDWNTAHQCQAHWPAAEVAQINLALAQLPGGTATVDDLVAVGFTYWVEDLDGLTEPLDPGYVAALPPEDPSDVLYPVSFSQAGYAMTIEPLMQANDLSCDEAVTLALYLGVIVAGNNVDGGGGSVARWCEAAGVCRVEPERRAALLESERRAELRRHEQVVLTGGRPRSAPERDATTSAARATGTASRSR